MVCDDTEKFLRDRCARKNFFEEGKCYLISLSGFTYESMTSLTTYMMSWIVWFEDILEKIRFLREFEQDRFDWFWQM